MQQRRRTVPLESEAAMVDWAEPVPDAPYPMTNEAFARWPESDRWRYELVRGRMYRMPTTGYQHGRITNRLAFALTDYAESRDLGEVVPPTRFLLPQPGRDDKLDVAPDVAYLTAEHAPEFEPSEALELAPDMVAEIASPRQNLTNKARDYLLCGVRLVWCIYPARRQVEVWQPGEVLELLGYADELDGREVIPGFRLGVRYLLTGKRSL